MFDYFAIRIETEPAEETINDLISAFLADIGFETFEPDEKGVTAYIRKDLYVPEEVRDILDNFPIKIKYKLTETEIKGEDWNKEWEQNYFKPIVIDDQVVIHSSFHKDYPKTRYEIVIDPKMAFGTGHHFTTSNMIRLILNENLEGKSVIDMGTGTGILSILSKEKGASDVSAIELDSFALENARENGGINKTDIKWIEGDASRLEGLQPVDYFFANINLNVILNDFESYVRKLKPEGKLLLSGFYETDLPKILAKAKEFGLKTIRQLIENNWVAIELQVLRSGL